MSNERFDRLMKQNLESVRPTYQPGTWNRFQKRLPVVGFWPWLLQYGGWVMSGLMLAGWLTTLYTLRENQQIMARLLPARTATITSEKAASISPAPVQSMTHRVDTVYILKRTIIEHRHRYYPANQVTGQVLYTTEHPRPANALAELDNSDRTSRTDMLIRNRKYDAADLPKTGNSQTNTDQPLAKRIDQSLPSTAGDKLTRNRTGTGNPPPENPHSGGVFDKTRTQSNRPLMTSADSINQAITKATATIPTDATQLADAAGKPVPPAAARIDSVAHSVVTTPPSVSAVASQPVRQSRPPFRFSSLLPRIGVETMATLNGVGVGPTLELFPAENIGLSVGIQASQQQAENHQELKGFNSVTGLEFIDQYKAFLPAQYDQIKDISVQTTLISLPINLKYYVPLRRNWSLLFQTGTNLDLAAYQQVRYESTYQGEEQFHSFEVNARPRLFHNFIFGAGVQYRLPRISLQLSPYYLYDFRSLVNTPVGSDVGIKASVWLNLVR